MRDLWGLRLGFFQKPLEEGARSGYSSGTGTAMFSSTSEGENTDTDGSGFKSTSSRRSRKNSKPEMERMPKLMETMGLIYLGMLLLRLPISMGEISRWIRRDEILYNRAVSWMKNLQDLANDHQIKEVPKDMRIKLPQQYHTALGVRAPFNGNTFHRTILSQIDYFHIEFDMVFPPLNVPLLLFKHVRDLGLPGNVPSQFEYSASNKEIVEIYPAVHRLSKILKMDFSYPILHQSTSRAIQDPEVHLVTLIVIATKLSQPFDDIKRTPISEADASALKMDWDEWRELMKDPPMAGLKRGEEMEVTDDAVMTMDGQKIDDYLDWFQRMWLDDRETKCTRSSSNISDSMLTIDPVPKPVLDRFSLLDISPQGPVPSNSEDRLSRLKQVQRSMIPQEAESIDEAFHDVQRPGDKYRRYRKACDIPAKAMPFFELAGMLP